jgi:ferrous-iron efflux pump FieF
MRRWQLRSCHRRQGDRLRAADSVSLLSTLLDSLLDAAASLINLLAVRHALTPADREHRFGHGKAEPLAALGQSTFIAGSAAFLIVQAANRLVSPHPVTHTAIGLGVMAFSIAATLLLVLFQRFVIRRTGSLAIKADSLHYASDLIVNASVVVALILIAVYAGSGSTRCSAAALRSISFIPPGRSRAARSTC